MESGGRTEGKVMERLLTSSLPVIIKGAGSVVLGNTFCLFTVKPSEGYHSRLD